MPWSQIAASKALADWCLIQLPGVGDLCANACQAEVLPFPSSSASLPSSPPLLERERVRLLRHLDGAPSVHQAVGAARALGEMGARCSLTVDGALIRVLRGAMLRNVSLPSATPLCSHFLPYP